MSDGDNISVKIVILGEPAVGKTSLRLNYIGKGMDQSGEFLMTLGADLSESSIKINENLTLDAQIWDIAGQENFVPIIGEYLRGVQGAILVYDMTRSYTFDAINKWLDRLHDANPELDHNIPFIIVGNKADLDNFYDYDEQKVLEFIDYINRHQLYSKTPVEHLNTSAKTGYSVQAAFKRLGTTIIRNFIELGENIPGATNLFDDLVQEQKEPDTSPEVEVEEEERLVKPSEILRRKREEQEKASKPNSSQSYTESVPLDQKEVIRESSHITSSPQEEEITPNNSPEVSSDTSEITSDDVPGVDEDNSAISLTNDNTIEDTHQSLEEETKPEISNFEEMGKEEIQPVTRVEETSDDLIGEVSETISPESDDRAIESDELPSTLEASTSSFGATLSHADPMSEQRMISRGMDDTVSSKPNGLQHSVSESENNTDDSIITESKMDTNSDPSTELSPNSIDQEPDDTNENKSETD